MRMLVWPTYSMPGNVGADSVYLYMRNVIRELQGVHVYLVTPDWPDGKGDVSDDLDELPWVTRLPTVMPTLYRMQEVMTPPEVIWRFAPQGGSIPVEALFSASPVRTLQIGTAWDVRMPRHDRPLKVTYDLLARDDVLKGWQSDPIELMQIAAGTYASDLNLFQSEIAEWAIKNTCRRFLSPAAMKKIEESGVTINAGVPLDRLDAVIGKVEKRPRFSVYYGGRINAVKRVDDLGTVTELAFSFGRDMDWVLCTGALGGFKQMKFERQFPMCELHVGTGMEESWKYMASCHVGIAYSRNEMFGLGYWEEMCAGLPLLVKRERWSEKMLPPDYPYWFDNATQLGVLLRHLYDRWKAGEDIRLAPEWVAYAREKFDGRRNSRQMADLIMAEATKRRLEVLERLDGPRGGAMKEMAAELLVDGMTLTELIEGMRRKAIKAKQFIGQRLNHARSNTTIDAYRVALSLGWRDDIEKKEPTFYASH